MKILYDFYKTDAYIYLRSLKETFVDHNICFKKFEGNFVLIITLYVDDSILTFNALVLKRSFEEVRKGEFELNLVFFVVQGNHV